MKREMDSVREILLQIEAYDQPRGWVTLTVPSHTAKEIAYHVQILDEAGFIEADNLSDTSGYDWQAKRLTYEGHEFLDTVRDAEAWRFTKETAKKAGVSSLTALFEIAKSYARQKLIEHGVHLT